MNSTQDDIQFVISDNATVKKNLNNLLTTEVVHDEKQSSSTKKILKHSFTQLTEAIMLAQQEENSVFNDVALVYEFILNLQNYSSHLQRNLTSEDSDKFLQNLFSIYQADPNMASDQQRLQLLNMLMTQEQGNLYFHTLSEYQDRLSSQQQNALLKVPIFKQFPQNFVDYMPIDDISLVSHQFLSSFLKASKFQSSNGNNKKIMSIGIPPGLFRHVRHNRSGNVTQQSLRIKDNIVRVKIYRIDKLHPEVVFLPQEFMFEMVRFPTRVVGNWNLNALFDSNAFDLGLMPTKIVDVRGNVVLHKNYEDAKQNYLNPNIFSEEEFSQVYQNHCLSFLLEEYIRWFSELKMDERIFCNYTGVKEPMDLTNVQYQNYYEIIKNSQDVVGAVGTATFDTLNGKVTKTVVKDVSAKGITVDLSDTIKSYFANETYLLDINEYKRRAVYPKKFDRVFNILISPDDFKVDSTNSTRETLNHLKERGILLGEENEYYLRDSTENDTTFDDYFVTIEPYDYTQEIETTTY